MRKRTSACTCLPALALSFMFFLTGLRVVHNAFHKALSLSHRLSEAVLWIMSFIMPGSLHTVRFNHLRHHRLEMSEEDFAMWTVHHHCDRTLFLARTLRNRIKNAITFDMIRHIEHHLFPAVPTCHLATLPERLDIVCLADSCL